MNEQYERVKEILINNPEAKDNDNLLLAMIWTDDLVKGEYSSYEVLYLLSKGSLTNPESIRRCRQKLQEEIPELRGEKYNQRHKELEPMIKNEIKEMGSFDERFGDKSEVEEKGLF